MNEKEATKTGWWNKRRVTASVVALALVATTLLAGTFAWNAISQSALNEAQNTVDPGGRLHDDFDGENKDVYVENYGTIPIYARIKLSEYMEIGEGAGKNNGTKNVTVFTPNADINNPGTWAVHKPGASVEDCANDADGLFHDYWAWTMGGQKNYMPTFNKDNTSLKTDITGLDTFGVDSETYQHNVSDPENGGTNVFSKDGSHNQYASGDTLTEDATYGATVKNETHTAKPTSNGTVMTMQQWIEAGKNPGAYWVVDTDGWAYWAQAIQPGTATGLLLNQISLKTDIDDDWYYAINVVSDFASLNESDMLKDGSTTEGKDLIDVISKGVITIENPQNDYDGGNDGELKVKPVPDAPGFYEVLDDDGKEMTPPVYINDPNNSIADGDGLDGDEEIAVRNPSDSFDGDNDQMINVKPVDPDDYPGVYEVLDNKGDPQAPPVYIVDKNDSINDKNSLDGDEEEVLLVDENNFPNEDFRDYVAAELDPNSDNALTLNERESIKEINVAGESVQNPGTISSIEGNEYFPNLEKIEAQNNELDEIDVTKNPKLIHLDVINNKLAALDVTKNPNLQVLRADRNDLVSIDVTKNPNLIQLYVGYNELETIDISENMSLEIFGCYVNKLEEVNVTNHTSLKTLTVHHNYLEDIDLRNLTNLTLFNGYNNLFTSLDISKNTKLTQLQIQGNLLTSIDVSTIPGLAGIESNIGLNLVVNAQGNSDTLDGKVYNTGVGPYDIPVTNN